MNTTTFGFVGGGRVTRIPLQGWRRRGALPSRAVVAEPSVSQMYRTRLAGIYQKIQPEGSR